MYLSHTNLSLTFLHPLLFVSPLSSPSFFSLHKLIVTCCVCCPFLSLFLLLQFYCLDCRFIYIFLLVLLLPEKLPRDPKPLSSRLPPVLPFLYHPPVFLDRHRQIHAVKISFFLCLFPFPTNSLMFSTDSLLFGICSWQRPSKKVSSSPAIVD